MGTPQDQGTAPALDINPRMRSTDARASERPLSAIPASAVQQLRAAVASHGLLFALHQKAAAVYGEDGAGQEGVG